MHRRLRQAGGTPVCVGGRRVRAATFLGRHKREIDGGNVNVKEDRTVTGWRWDIERELHTQGNCDVFGDVIRTFIVHHILLPIRIVRTACTI